MPHCVGPGGRSSAGLWQTGPGARHLLQEKTHRAWVAGREGHTAGNTQQFPDSDMCWQNTNTPREEKRVLGTSSRSPGCILGQAHTVRGLSGRGSASRGVTLYAD